MSNPSKLQLLDNLRLAIENRSMSSVIAIYKLMVKQYGQEGQRVITEHMLRMSAEDLVWFNQQQQQQQQQQQSNSYGSRSFFN